MDHGQSADREGDLRRANEDLTTLLAINPNDPYAKAYKVCLLLLGWRGGHTSRAVSEGERNIALNQGFVHTYFYLCPGLHRCGATGEGHRLRGQGDPVQCRTDPSLDELLI